MCAHGEQERDWNLLIGFLQVQQKQKKKEVSMSLASKVRGYWIGCQQELFPWMEETLGSLEGRHKKLLAILEMVPIEQFLPRSEPGTSGHPLKDRVVLARAFLAKMVFNMDHDSVGGMVTLGSHAAAFMWMAREVRCAECVDIFACVQRVCKGEFAIPRTRSGDKGGICGPVGGSPIAGFDRDRWV